MKLRLNKVGGDKLLRIDVWLEDEDNPDYSGFIGTCHMSSEEFDKLHEKAKQGEVQVEVKL